METAPGWQRRDGRPNLRIHGPERDVTRDVTGADPLEPAQPKVRPVSGDLAIMVADARRAAADRDVWIDGGALIRSALGAGLIELTYRPHRKA